MLESVINMANCLSELSKTFSSYSQRLEYKTVVGKSEK